MCGIVGYIGGKKATPILLQGLLCLEYRGYDSAGIATIEKGGVIVMKDKGRVANLQSLEGIDELDGKVGIAHTRWATHGKPSKENSHPHMDENEMFAVVHNGIIENYCEIKKFLQEKGYKFKSETDTEVIPNLIHYYYISSACEGEARYLDAVKSCINNLKGSYAIEVISKNIEDRIIVAKKDSPLIIGKGVDENYIASDIPAILKYTNEIYMLKDNEIAVVYKDNIEIFNNELEKQNRETKIIDWNFDDVSKEGFDDYMLKEIFEQPKAIKETITSRIPLNDKCDFTDLDISKEYLESINIIYIVACGTAMHAGLVAKNVIERLCKIYVEVEIASEFRYKEPLVDEKTLCIYISQSGETADTIAALKLAKEFGAKTLAVSNVIDSSITREADYTIYTHAGPEIAVASTKAYTAQVALLTTLAIYFAEILGTTDKEELENLKQELLTIPAKLETVLGNINTIKEFADKFYTAKDMFFLGRGIDYSTSLEASLKVKEISYIHSEAYAAGELKHGTIALIEEKIPVVGIMTDENLVEKTVSNIQEVITRGAITLIVTNQELVSGNYNYVVNIPKVNKLLSPILAVAPLQILSYYVSKNKGLDVDKPRNLAKSVTVE